MTLLMSLALMLSMTPAAVFAAGSEDYGFDVTTEEEAAQKDLEKELLKLQTVFLQLLN